jgi:lipoprotein Spr
LKKNTLIFLILFSISFVSCRTSKSSIITDKEKAKEKGIYSYDDKGVKIKKGKSSKFNSKKNSNNTITSIVASAKENLGVSYKGGGTTKSGMDCSGLVYSTFQKYDFSLPRSSNEMAKEGREVSVSKAQEGDLIFFKTNRSNSINHVGIITEIFDGEIKFIHSSTSKGVIISSLKESYYSKNFAQINRVLD